MLITAAVSQIIEALTATFFSVATLVGLAFICVWRR